ncbi:RiPP maturation radical SAM C-methyltransferase [Nocardiopsis xinjiangensis]|uniref:RiPP maturation radical SAM C-methyltransferase n=1 Tax=Nocardiopsis xinjiangensis TaxID=124285 RepID=UPI000344FA35|nr:RiPP maturation radical SAM C-methyltransferase [Nocardiopsis xinjiangensis]
MEILWPHKRSSVLPTRVSRVALINMPWSRVDTPSIQCGLLKSVLEAGGHEVDVHYLNIELAADLGVDVYEAFSDLSSERVTLLGEWLFSRASYMSDAGGTRDYIIDFPEVLETAKNFDIGEEGLISLREKRLPAWLDEVSQRDWMKYDLIGFSSTFMQNVSSLALARRIKERFPEIPITFGGANFDGVMGLEFFRAHDFIDFAVIGEGEAAFPELVRRVSLGETDIRIPGVLSRHTSITPSTQEVRAPSIVDLDLIPTPDYTDYFETLGKYGGDSLLRERRVELLIEFSRGCWWGAKHHCTFCGLNALGMDYRAKSPERAFAEMEALLRNYKISAIAAVDNILDMKYLGEFCGSMADSDWTLSLFFEVKANLDRGQVHALASAGVTAVQPGIESLSSNVLKLMRKGSDSIINIRLLKWALHFNISVHWNILSGFPGERDEDYRLQADLIPLLHHLEPPNGVNPIWLERFSPYFNGHSSHIKNIRPRRSYYHVYPQNQVRTEDVSYFFDADINEVASPSVLGELSEAVENWKALWRKGNRPTMFARRGPGWLEILDRRNSPARRISMNGWQAYSYNACMDNFKSRSRLVKEVGQLPENPSEDEINCHIDRCLDEGLLIEDQGRIFALALPFQY